jgi:hypothetical protein
MRCLNVAHSRAPTVDSTGRNHATQAG